VKAKAKEDDEVGEVVWFHAYLFKLDAYYIIYISSAL
jgi:hypothetical protein